MKLVGGSKMLKGREGARSVAYGLTEGEVFLSQVRVANITEGDGVKQSAKNVS